MKSKMRPQTHVYGDTIYIIPEEFVVEASAWGHVLKLDRRTSGWADAPELVADLGDWKPMASQMAAQVQVGLKLNPMDLPDEAIVSRYLRRGFLLEAALARSLEELCGQKV